MPRVGEFEPKHILITARTYPTPARNGVEVSCTGGITDQGQWVRLFPVPYRFLTSDKRFRKYQWIDVRAAKSSDPRPESYMVDIDSIKIVSEPLSTSHSWQARKERVLPLKSPSLCSLQDGRRDTGTSLGFFKPKIITKFEIVPEQNVNWTPEEQEKLVQHGLFEAKPVHPLEKIPYKFYYSFKCDDANCRNHRLSCVDWELGQAYRSWRQDYGANWQQALRNKFEHQMIEQLDTHFFVGTMRAHPDSWIIVGLFYPPKAPSTQLSPPTQLSLW